VRHDFERDAYFSAKSQGPDGLVCFADRVRLTDSWTNLDNDKARTIVKHRPIQGPEGDRQR
jgi:hypothetical protein